jgi:hypothetical protein
MIPSRGRLLAAVIQTSASPTAPAHEVLSAHHTDTNRAPGDYLRPLPRLKSEGGGRRSTSEGHAAEFASGQPDVGGSCWLTPCPARPIQRPCPCLAAQPPSGDTWIHEIKHDGFRVIARKKDLLITSGYCCTNL